MINNKGAYFLCILIIGSLYCQEETNSYQISESNVDNAKFTMVASMVRQNDAVGVTMTIENRSTTHTIIGHQHLEMWNNYYYLKRPDGTIQKYRGGVHTTRVPGSDLPAYTLEPGNSYTFKKVLSSDSKIFKTFPMNGEYEIYWKYNKHTIGPIIIEKVGVGNLQIVKSEATYILP